MPAPAGPVWRDRRCQRLGGERECRAPATVLLTQIPGAEQRQHEQREQDERRGEAHGAIVGRFLMVSTSVICVEPRSIWMLSTLPSGRSAVTDRIWLTELICLAVDRVDLVAGLEAGVVTGTADLHIAHDGPGRA